MVTWFKSEKKHQQTSGFSDLDLTEFTLKVYPPGNHHMDKENSSTQTCLGQGYIDFFQALRIQDYPEIF